MNIYMAGTLAGDELPGVGQEVPFTSLPAARQCQEQVYRTGLGKEDRADGFGVDLSWEQHDEQDVGEFYELTDRAGTVEPRTGFYVRVVRVFDTAEEFDAAAETAGAAAGGR